MSSLIFYLIFLAGSVVSALFTRKVALHRGLRALPLWFCLGFLFWPASPLLKLIFFGIDLTRRLQELAPIKATSPQEAEEEQAILK